MPKLTVPCSLEKLRFYAFIHGSVSATGVGGALVLACVWRSEGNCRPVLSFHFMVLKMEPRLVGRHR